MSLENGDKQLTIPEEQEEETLLDEQKSESTASDEPVVEISTSEKNPTLLAEQPVESKALEQDEVLPATRKPEEGVNCYPNRIVLALRWFKTQLPSDLLSGHPAGTLHLPCRLR